MYDLFKQFEELARQVKTALSQISATQIQQQINDLQIKANDKNFWLDQKTATTTTKQISKLTAKIKPWIDLDNQIKDSLELAKTGDESLLSELGQQYLNIADTYGKLKSSLMFNGKYDDRDVILSIYAGAGGTDAQDWAEMLQRMYLRWAERQADTEAEILEQSTGEEAGIKSVTIAIGGNNAYGKLQGENGVHRLVRLSPFNADNLRQTSFAKVEIMPKIDQPEEIAINDKDLKIDVYRAGGHGGQSVNTTDSAVRITHLPTGLTVAIQNERSQLQNKETAMTILRSRLAKMQLEQHKEKTDELKGPNEQAAWGNQIRSYVLHPYSMVKDLRTRHETSDVKSVLDGDLDGFIQSYLEWFIDKQ